MALYMVVESFRPGEMVEVYRRVRAEGRGLPQGLTYVDSWVEANLQRCFQLMECDDLALMQDWVARWEGYGRFEIVPVTTSKETFALMERLAQRDEAP